MNYDLLRSQDFLTNYVKTKKDVLLFQLKLAKKAINSSRKELIYTPSYNEDHQLLQLLLSKCTKTEINKAELCNSDDELPYDDELYKFITFSIYSTPIIFKKSYLIKGIENLEQFEVQNTYEQEQQLAKHGNKRCYLFHGSRMENWYSIIKNGIKICSGTKLQLNGKVYGNGIYLSDDVKFATGYCDSGIVGVFEVIGNKELYKKTRTIYVVTDDTKLVLRYFLSFNKNNKTEVFKKINECFNTTIYNEKAKVKKKSTSFREKRIYKELSCIGDKFMPIDGDLYMWKALSKPTDFDKDSNIRKDMIKYGIPHVEFEIKVPEKYPYEPLFVRIVKPIFKYRTGHITVGGSICVDILTPLRWSPAMKIQSTIETVESLIVDAQIDNTTDKQEYKRDEGLKAFNRVAKDHGWLS